MMKQINIFKLFYKPLYIIVFLLLLIINYFLLPDYIFQTSFFVLADLFILIMSLTIIYTIFIVREKVKVAQKLGKSLLNIILFVLGFIAFEMCGPLCGVGVFYSLIAIVVPLSLMKYFEGYNLYIIIISIIFQLIILWKMKAFSKETL